MAAPPAIPLARPLAVPLTGRVLSVPFVPAAPTYIAALGDSITQQNSTWATTATTGLVGEFAEAGYFTHANKYLGHRLEILRDPATTPAGAFHFGASGFTCSQVLATMVPRLKAAHDAAGNPHTAVLIECGTNDITTDADTATILASYQAVVNSVAAQTGLHPVTCEILPRLSATGEATRKTTRLAFNAAIKAWSATKHYPHCEWGAIGDDGSGYANAALFDAVAPGHPLTYVAWEMGRVAAAAIEAGMTLPGDWLTNALFATNKVTGGDISANFTTGWPFGFSNAPIGFRCDVSGGLATSAVVGSKVARTDGGTGSWFQLAITGASASQGLTFRPDNGPTPTAGKTFYAAMEVECDAAGFAPSHIECGVACFTGNYSIDGSGVAATHSTPWTGKLVLRSPPRTLESGLSAIRMYGKILGSGTFRFGRMGLYEI